MSFIFRNRKDDGYLIGEPWMSRFRNRKCGRIVYDRYEEDEMTKVCGTELECVTARVELK